MLINAYFFYLSRYQIHGRDIVVVTMEDTNPDNITGSMGIKTDTYYNCHIWAYNPPWARDLVNRQPHACLRAAINTDWAVNVRATKGAAFEMAVEKAECMTRIRTKWLSRKFHIILFGRIPQMEPPACYDMQNKVNSTCILS